MGFHSKKQEKLLASASVIPLISIPLLSAGFALNAEASEKKWDANLTARIHGDRNDVSTSAELFLPLGQDDDSLFYLDLRIVPEDLGSIQGNFGAGIRQIVNENLIVGGYAFFDTAGVQGYRFHAATVGVELITKAFDAHVNYHTPFTKKVTTASGAGPNSSALSLVGNQLIESYQSGNNYISGMRGFSGELGYTLFFDNPLGETIAPRELRLSAGAFSFDGFQAQARRGFTANAEYTLNDALGIDGAKLSFGIGVIHDNINDTNLVAGVRLTIPIGNVRQPDVEGEATSTYQPPLTRIEQRMVSRVRRITRMQTQEVNNLVTISRVAVDALDASLYNYIWFADGANTIGAGSQPDPTTIDHAVASAGTNGIIVAEGNNRDITTPGGVTLQAGQEVLGGGTAIPVRKLNNTVVNFTLGQTNGVIRNLSNAANTINLGNNNILRNFTVRGGMQGIAGNGISGATLDNIIIDQSATDGLSLQNFSGTFTGTNIMVTNAGDDAIEIFNSNAIFNFTDTTVTTAADEGVDIDNILSTVSFTRLTISGAGDDGLDITGSAGTFSFDTTTITNTTNNGVDINGAVGPIAFNGTTTVNNSGDDGLDFDNVTGGAVTFSGPLNVGGAGDDGIDISNSSATFSFADVTIDGTVGGNGIAIDDFTGTASFNGTTTITGPGGNGLSVSTQSGALTFDTLDITGGAASRDGILVQGNLLGAGLNINTLNIDGFGNGPFSGGVVFAAATGTVNIFGGTIQNVGNDGVSFVVNTSNINATFGGNIVHTGNGALSSAVFIDDFGGPDTSTVTFTAGSTISDTAGRGLRFENSDGTYNFNGQVILNGGDAGIDILGGSDGTFTFTNTDITSPTGTGVNIVGGTSNVTFGASSSLNQANNASAVSITGGHNTGTVSFAAGSTINATNGDGLQFNNVDGTYNFNGQVTLNGGDAGIDILGGSAGTFTFTNTDITSPTGTAVNIDTSTANVTFAAGSTIIQNNAATAIRINAQTGGAVAFNGAITANTANFGAIDLTNNTGGTINFAGGLNLNTTSGDGFGATSGGTVSVTGAGNTINSTMARAINLDGVTIGAGGMTFATIGTANSTVDGARFNNVAEGAFSVTGATTINNATNDGIDITNSAAAFTFASVNIDGGVQGIDLNTNTGIFTVNGGTIDGTTGDGINALNTRLNVSGVTFGATTAIGGDGIDILNSDGTNRTSILNGNTIGSATADITGRGVVIGSTGAGVATVNFVGNNSIRSTNAALEATATNTNTLVMALDNITAERATAGFTIDIQGASHAAQTAPIVVTSLNSFTIVANGINGGALFNNVAFDADGVSGGAVTQVTATGTTNIGQGVAAAQRVQGDGLSFLSPNGDINFTTLNIFNNGGTGLEVDTKSVAPTTTFNLVVGAGGVNTTAGAAVFLDPLTGSLIFGSITGSGSATAGATSTGASGNGNAITIDGFIGTLTSGSTTITGLAAGETGVSFINNTAGTTVNLGVTSISSAANNVIGIDLQNTNGETVTTGAGSSINLTGTGTVGVDLSAVGTNANFTFGDGTAPPSSTIVVATPIDFTGIGALGTYNFLDVDFTNVNLGAAFGQNSVHYFAQTAQGLGDGSSAANASNTTTADAVTTANTTFIAVGGGNLDVNTNGDGTFNLAADQDLATYATVGGTIRVCHCLIEAYPEFLR